MTTMNGPRAAGALTGDAWLPGVRLLRAEFIKLTRRRRLHDRGRRPDRGRGDRQCRPARCCAARCCAVRCVLSGAGSSGLVLVGTGGAVAALLGLVAGAADVAAGVFPSLVTTGRSRVALFLARVPVGLALSAAFTLAG